MGSSAETAKFNQNNHDPNRNKISNEGEEFRFGPSD